MYRRRTSESEPNSLQNNKEEETETDGDGGGKMWIRIHVGGLGGTVTEVDLRRMFSGGGTVEGVDIVRTKGRSFAYVDFLPSDDKSLSKLFTTVALFLLFFLVKFLVILYYIFWVTSNKLS